MTSRGGKHPIVSFVSVDQWQNWLDKNHARSKGVLLCFQKKSSHRKSPTYAEALDAALCYGWIDGQAKPRDASSWLQKFTHRRARSGWSKRNTEHAERLTRPKSQRRAENGWMRF